MILFMKKVFLLLVMCLMALSMDADSVLRGDVNDDSSVNISDVTALIDYLLSGDEIGIGLANADCNVDNTVNIADVTCLIDYLLSDRWPSGELMPRDTTFMVGSIPFKMVYVEGGTFTMGTTAEQANDYNTNEQPAHRVTLSSFYICSTEVTQALWLAVMGSNPSYFIGDLDCPVEQVTWENVQVFIEKLNAMTNLRFRLPTEAEWEFAARGGNKSIGYKYAGSNNASSG